MKTTMKALLLITAAAIALPAVANDAKTRAKDARGNYYNSQRPIQDANGNDTRTVYDADTHSYRSANTSDHTWLGMRSTTKGMKSGASDDVNNRDTNPYVLDGQRSNVRFGASKVVKH